MKTRRRSSKLSHEQKPQMAIRLLAVLGFSCIIVAFLLLFLTILFLYIGAYDASLYCRMAGPIAGINLLIAFVAGIFVKKHCPPLGSVLIVLSLALILFGLSIPKL